MDIVAALPWPVGIVLGIAAFLFIRFSIRCCCQHRAATKGAKHMPKRRVSVAIACLLAAPLARAELSIETSANLGANIVDDAYNGTLASMTCVAIPVVGTGHYPVDALTVTVWLDHTWIGDLVFKVLSPDNTVVTLMSRPGMAEVADDGTSTGGAGDSSNLVSTHPIEFIDGGAKSAESMGDGLSDSQAVCRDDAACVYDPNNGAAAPGKLSNFRAR